MKHLVVVAHPREESFNRQVSRNYVAALKARGHDVVLRDLYTMNFQPVASAKDLVAMKTGVIAPDVKVEMDHISWCEVLTFIHPIWWIDRPAILKGWIDRVFALGFAYGYGGPTGARGGLHGRKAVVITSSGSTHEHFLESGKMAAILKVQDFGTMEFCGFEMIEHIHFAPVGTRSTPEMIAENHARIQAFVEEHF